MKALDIRSLEKSFWGIQALRDVHLDFEQGQLLAVLGPSGCGKTTLLRCIAGFEIPDSGSVSINGEKVFDSYIHLPPEKRKVGYVPQEGSLFPHLTVGGNVSFGLSRSFKRSGRVQELLSLVGMHGMEKRMPYELSGGQQQRVALARALAPSPSLVLLDEPFSALDAGLRASLREDVRHALKRAGATGLMVTHDQEEALSMADMVAVMRDGHIIQSGDPVTLYQSPANIEIATFLGEATFIQGKLYNGCIECPFGSLQVAPGCPLHCGNATVMIRPEQFIVGAPDEGIHAQVEKVTFYGHDALIQLRLPGEYGGYTVCTRVLSGGDYKPGQMIGLTVRGNVMAYSPEKTEMFS